LICAFSARLSVVLLPIVQHVDRYGDLFQFDGMLMAAEIPVYPADVATQP